MTDDIVTRLRDAAWVPAGDDCETNDDRLFREAADEIEHLREWKVVADMFGKCFRMDEFGQFPTSNDGDVLEAVKAWERLRTKEVRQ